MLLNQVVLALAVTGLCIAVPTAADLDDVTAKRTESNATIPYANEDPKAMPLGAFTWSGPLVPGGPVTSFEAKSAEDAYHRLREMISGYDAAMFAVSSNREVSDNKAFSVLDRLQKRDNWKVDCWTDFAADADRIREGEDYLHRIHGNCALRPWVCSRVSCSWDAGITFCNTNRNNPLSIPCSSIGDLSALIRQECHRNPFRGYYYDLDFPFQVHDEWQSC